MNTSELIKKSEEAQAEFRNAESREAELRQQYQTMVAEKLGAEMDLKSFGAPRERRLASLRLEVIEAAKIVQAKKSRIEELRAMLVTSELTEARKRQCELVQRAIDASNEVLPHLRALEEISQRIHATSAEEYEFTRGINKNLDLFNTKLALNPRLHRNEGGILPPLHFDLEVWEQYQRKYAKNLLSF